MICPGDELTRCGTDLVELVDISDSGVGLASEAYKSALSSDANKTAKLVEKFTSVFNGSTSSFTPAYDELLSKYQSSVANVRLVYHQWLSPLTL